MAISTNGTVLARLAGGLYNQTLSNATYEEVVATVKSAADINALANDLYARDFASKTDAQVATTLVANLGLSSVAGLNNWVAAQLTAAGSAKGAKIVSLLNDFANLASDATYGAAATAFNTKTSAALALSQKAGSAGGTFDAAAAIAEAAAAAAAAKAAADTAAAEAAAASAKAAADKVAADALAAENAPQTLTLTTGANTFTGKSGNDTFDGSLTSSNAQTLNTLDRLDGGAGTDELNATLSASVTPTSVTNIETINVGSTAAVTLGLGNSSGVSAVNIGGATGGTFTLAGVSKSVAVSVADSAVAHTISYKDVTGTADSAAVTLANMTGAADLTVAGVETLTIRSSGSANNIDLEAAAATTLTISGSGDLTISALDDGGADADSNKLSSINASEMTGSLNVTTGAMDIGATTLTIAGGTGNDSIDVSGNDGLVSVSGGAGNDTVTITLATTDTVSGGDGEDTLVTDAAISSAGNVSGFETFRAGAAISQDFDHLAGNTFTAVETAIVGAATVSFTDVAASVATLRLNTVAVGANTDTVTVDRKTDTGSDALTIVARGANQTTVTANDEESLTVTSATAATTITTLNAADLTSLTITGDENLTIGSLAGTVGLANVNASASTGAVSIGATANGSQVAMTITAGIGGMTADGSALNDTMVGGDGIDSFDGNEGNDSLLGGAGNDDLDGGAGNDILDGAAGNDSITAGTGNDNISGGVGNDTINIADNYTLDDTVDGGDGTDTVQLTGANGTTTPTLTSIEALTLTAATGGTNTYALTNATSVTAITIADSTNNVATTISSFTGGRVTVSEDDDVATTIDTIANATLSVTANADNNDAATGDLTITDAASVSIGTSLDGATFDEVVLDSVDTTSLTVSATSTFDIATGDVTGTASITSLTLSSATNEVNADVEVDLGTFATASALTTLTITADGGEVDIGAIGGTAAANVLASIIATATVGGDITVGAITADTTDSVSDNNMTVTASADGSSTVTFDDVNNQFGNMTVAASGDGVVDFTANNGTLTAVNVVLTRSGAGATTIDDIAASGTFTVTATGSGALNLGAAGNVTVTGNTSIDASASSGALTVDSDSTANITVLGGSGSDSISITGTTASGKVHSVDGGAGDDTITGGAGADKLIGGLGNDSITSGGGNDNLEGGAGNDTFVLSTTLTSADTVSGGDGTDTLTFTTAAVTTTLSLADIEIVEVISAGTHTVDLSASTGLTRVINADGGDHAFGLTGLASGVVVRNLDNADTLTIDTAAGATVTLEANVTNAVDVTFTDAASITVRNGLTTAGDIDIAGLVLDNVDTTSLTIAGSSVAGNDLDVDNITNSNALATLNLSTSGTGVLNNVGTVADIDALTSLTIAASTGNITIGQLGTDDAANNGEVLATIAVSAAGGATATVGAIYADSVTNSTTDLAQTVTASAAASSTVNFNATGVGIDNTYGSITAVLSGQGTINTGSLIADDITITRTDGGATTIDAITTSDDLTITASGSGTFTITTMGVTGDYAIDGSGKTGNINIAANTSTGLGTITGGSGQDTLTGAAGNESISGGDANDTLVSGAGNDTLDGGAGNDTFTMDTNLATGDVITGGDGTDTLTATITSSRNATISGVEVLSLSLNGGAFNGENTTGATTLNVTGNDDSNAVVTQLNSSVRTINQLYQKAVVSYGYSSGSAATATYDFDSAEEAITNDATTISNVAALTVDADGTHAVDLGSLTATAMTSLTISGDAAAVDVGNLTAASLSTISATVSGAGGITIGDLATATALTSVTLSGGAGAGNLTVGAIGATVSAQRLTSVNTTTDENGATQVVIGDITGVDTDISTADTDDAELTTFTLNIAGDFDSSTVGTIAVESIGTIDIDVETSSSGADSLVIAAFNVYRQIGAITIDSADDVTFTSGFDTATYTGATSIGDITINATGGTLDIDADADFVDGFDSVGNISITTAGGVVDAGEFDAVDSVGNITISAQDNVSVDGAGDALSIGNFVVTVTTGDTVDLNGDSGTHLWGAAGATIGTFTASGAGSVAFSTGAVLSMGDINLSDLTGASTIVLSDSTAIGVNFTGGTGADTFVGTGAADAVTGGDGNDTLTGGTGSDDLNGGAGDDTFVVAGTTQQVAGDVIAGSTGTNSVSIDNSGGAVTAEFDFDNISNVLTLTVADADGSSTNAQAVTVTFSAITETTAQTVVLDASVLTDADDDLVVTNSAASSTTVFSITGGAGDDTIVGSLGADTLTGGTGVDVITGGAGNDTIVLGAAGDIDTVNFGATVAANGSDTITGFTSGVDILNLDPLLDGITKGYAEYANGTTDFAAGNVIVIAGTTAIGDAATAIAADTDVVATIGLIVVSDGTDTFIYHSTNLAANGTETLIATIAGVASATSLATADFIFS